MDPLGEVHAAVTNLKAAHRLARLSEQLSATT